MLGILLSYAFHAFVILHVPRMKLKLQDAHEYNKEPRAMAVRECGGAGTPPSPLSNHQARKLV